MKSLYIDIVRERISNKWTWKVFMDSQKRMVLMVLSRCNFDKFAYIENKFHHNPEGGFLLLQRKALLQS